MPVGDTSIFHNVTDNHNTEANMYSKCSHVVKCGQMVEPVKKRLTSQECSGSNPGDGFVKVANGLEDDLVVRRMQSDVEACRATHTGQEELTGVRGAVQRLGNASMREYEDLKQTLSEEARHYTRGVNQLLRDDLQADLEVPQGRLGAAEAPGGGSSTEQVSAESVEVVQNMVLVEYTRPRSENPTLG